MSSRFAARALLFLLAVVAFGACGGKHEDAAKDRAAAGGPNGVAELGEEQQLDRPKLDVPIALSTTAVGPLALGRGATLAAATKAFGAPDVQGPGDADPAQCAATWSSFGLTLLFSAGDEARPDASCRTGRVVAAYVTSRDWTTRPGGLKVGDDDTDVARAHARARKTRLPAAVQRVLGDEDGWLLEPGGRPPLLYAASDDGTVETLVLTAGTP
jgi:hypothetical protein